MWKRATERPTDYHGSATGGGIYNEPGKKTKKKPSQKTRFKNQITTAPDTALPCLNFAAVFITKKTQQKFIYLF